MDVRTDKGYFCKYHQPLGLHNKECVYCAVGTERLYIARTYINLVNQLVKYW